MQGFVREGGIVYDPLRDIEILFMVNGDYRIEIVAPKSSASVVAGMLKKTGASPYHICYCCENILSGQEELSERGYSVVSEIQPAIAIAGRNVCFMYNRHIGIIELVEWPDEDSDRSAH